jgi:rhodanese-related sulfurtransferase
MGGSDQELFQTIRTGVPGSRAVSLKKRPATCPHHATGGFGKGSARGFAQYALSKLASFGAGIGSGGAFNRRRIGDRSRIPNWLVLFVPGFRGPQSDDSTFDGCQSRNTMMVLQDEDWDCTLKRFIGGLGSPQRGGKLLLIDPSLPLDKMLVIYCASKEHEDSTDVARQLSLLGYRNVKVLKGGWFKWVALKETFCKVCADNENLYILRHHSAADEWRLESFRRLR